MKEVKNTLEDLGAAYNAYVAHIKNKFESEANNFIADFDSFLSHSEGSASAFVWIEPKQIIHYRSKAKPADIIEVNCIMFDFRFTVTEGKIIINGIGHFNHEKFKGRNADRLRAQLGTIVITGYDKISTIELPANSSIDIIKNSFSELFDKCIAYYFLGRIKEELLLEFGLTANEAETFLSILNKIAYNQETAEYINDQFNAAIPFEGGMTPNEALINLREIIKANP